MIKTLARDLESGIKILVKFVLTWVIWVSNFINLKP